MRKALSLGIWTFALVLVLFLGTRFALGWASGPLSSSATAEPIPASTGRSASSPTSIPVWGFMTEVLAGLGSFIGYFGFKPTLVRPKKEAGS